MEWLVILKTSFFVFWPFLIIGFIILSKKIRKNKAAGRSLWFH